jgi:hypothetical protein
MAVRSCCGGRSWPELHAGASGPRPRGDAVTQRMRRSGGTTTSRRRRLVPGRSLLTLACHRAGVANTLEGQSWDQHLRVTRRAGSRATGCPRRTAATASSPLAPAETILLVTADHARPESPQVRRVESSAGRIVPRHRARAGGGHRAGHGAQVARRAAVAVGDGGRAGGLQGDVLGGQGLEEPLRVDPGGTQGGCWRRRSSVMSSSCSLLPRSAGPRGRDATSTPAAITQRHADCRPAGPHPAPATPVGRQRGARPLASTVTSRPEGARAAQLRGPPAAGVDLDWTSS